MLSLMALFGIWDGLYDPIGFTLFRLLYGMSCCNKAHWTIQLVNFDSIRADKQRLLQLNELDEQRSETYENSSIHKKKKRWHDKHLKKKEFKEGDSILLYNSRLYIFSKKLKSQMVGLFTVHKVFPYGAIEVTHPENGTFKVNAH